MLARAWFVLEVATKKTALALAMLMVPTLALAQSMPGPMAGPKPSHMPGMMNMGQVEPAIPTQPGQGAFAAIQEIVDMLVADPNTDWSKVNIEALRQHLIDMNNVTLDAQVKNQPIDGGMIFTVSGTGAVVGSIQRMVMAHAATMNGVNGWHYAAANTATGATLTVKPPAADLPKLRGLGFIGVLTLGMHHQVHHMMIAHGETMQAQ